MATYVHCDLCLAVIPQGDTVGRVTIKRSVKSNLFDADLECCAQCVVGLLGQLADAAATAGERAMAAVPVAGPEVTE